MSQDFNISSWNGRAVYEYTCIYIIYIYIYIYNLFPSISNQLLFNNYLEYYKIPYMNRKITVYI